MMRFWRSRYATPVSMLPSLAGSVAAHAVLVAAAVTVTQRPAPADVPLPANSIARFLAPPNRSVGQRYQPERIRFVALGVPHGVVPRDLRIAVTQAADEVLSGLDRFDAPPLEELVGRDSVFSQIEVDSAASRYAWSAAPVFPPAMLALRQGGFVRAQWVVDERGIADTATFRILESTHPEFTKSVRDALPFMRFRPARIGATPVRQLVQQPFHFQITTATTDSAARRNPAS